jgi:Tol biopolymer transport system component
VANDCSDAAMSPDGRFLAYATKSTGRIFLLDRQTSATRLVSHAHGSVAPATGLATEPAISADGRWVAFVSTASDLISNPVSGQQVYLYDSAIDTNSLVSHRASIPNQATDGDSGSLTMTPDGAFLAFFSTGNDLVAGQVDRAGTDDVFLFDRATGTIRLVSRRFNDPLAAVGAYYPTRGALLSDDGRYLAFAFAGDLVGHPEIIREVYMFDRTTDTNTLLSREAESGIPAGAIYALGMSADGATVLFSSGSSKLVRGQVASPDYQPQLYLYRRDTTEVILASGAGGSPTLPGNFLSAAGSLSRDGMVAVFSSYASDLVPFDLNGNADVFAYVESIPAPVGPTAFFTVAPCRLLDTRLASGDGGGPLITAGYDRNFAVGGRCGIPPGAKAVSVNLTVTEATAPGHLKLFAGGAAPSASSINYVPAQTRANNVVAYLGSGGGLTIRCEQMAGTVQAIVDVNGYFE